MPEHPDFKNLYIIDHPLVQDRLSYIRRKDTSFADFRRVLRDISVLMAYEVTKDLEMTTEEIQTPVQNMAAPVLAKPEPVIIPILRAGLGLSDALTEVLTGAVHGHIGVFRDEKTHRPVEYMVKLPGDISTREVIVVDPMLATGHSIKHSLDILTREGVAQNQIKLMILVAAPEGVALVREHYPDIAIYTAALDSHLNEKAYIVPGLGDAGDRFCGTIG